MYELFTNVLWFCLSTVAITVTGCFLALIVYSIATGLRNGNKKENK